jgi:SsrA-binding protein
VAKTEGAIKILSENRKARFNYHIEEVFEAGLVLKGPEIKSARAGHVNLEQSYVRPEVGEMFLLQAHFEPYRFDTSAASSLETSRKRKLLLNRSEINKLTIGVERKGLTIVPLKLYLKRGYAKMEIALVKGKAAPDKRETVKKRESEREARRAMKRGD